MTSFEPDTSTDQFVVQDEGRGEEPFVVYELDDSGDVVDTIGHYADEKEADNALNTAKAAKE